MKLTAEEAREVVWEDHEDFTTIEKKIVDTSRWSIQYEGIFQHTPTGKFYSVDWQIGATEYQDESPFEYEKEVEFTEVAPQEITVIKYLPVK